MIAFLADAFVKATILLLLAAGAAVLLRRAAAAYRHLVWLLACAGVLVLPIAAALTPDLTVPAWPDLNVPVAFDAEQIAGPALREAPETPRTQPTATTSAPRLPTASITSRIASAPCPALVTARTAVWSSTAATGPCIRSAPLYARAAR